MTTVDIDAKRLKEAIQKHVGINEQLYALKQHSAAITDPKKYLADYEKAIIALKAEMDAETDALLTKGKKAQETYGYTDEYVHQAVGEQVSAMYNSRLNQLRSAFPDIDSAAKQINIGRTPTVGVTVRRAPARRASARRASTKRAPAKPKKKTTRRKTTRK